MEAGTQMLGSPEISGPRSSVSSRSPRFAGTARGSAQARLGSPEPEEACLSHYMYIYNIHIFMYIYTSYIYREGLPVSRKGHCGGLHFVHVCFCLYDMSLYTYIYIYLCIYLCVYIYIYIYVILRVSIYIHVYWLRAVRSAPPQLPPMVSPLDTPGLEPCARAREGDRD